jgi:hypothetical protein
MVTEGHEYDRREEFPKEIKSELDKEFSEIRGEMEKIVFRMKHEEKVH